MLAGPLNKRVWLQRPTDSSSIGGAPVTTFTDWVPVWAAIEPMQPREFVAGNAVNSDITTRIRIRKREGLNSVMRVRRLHGPGSPQIEDLYDVQGPPVEVMTNNTEIWLMCKLRNTQGFRTGPR